MSSTATNECALQRYYAAEAVVKHRQQYPQVIEVEAVQAEPGDSSSIYLGKSLFAFTEGRPARLNIPRARGQHGIELHPR